MIFDMQVCNSNGVVWVESDRQREEPGRATTLSMCASTALCNLSRALYSLSLLKRPYTALCSALKGLYSFIFLRAGHYI